MFLPLLEAVYLRVLEAFLAEPAGVTLVLCSLLSILAFRLVGRLVKRLRRFTDQMTVGAKWVGMFGSVLIALPSV